MKKKKILGLIPVRLNSSRLNQKSLLLIKKIPLIIHTYRRAKLSKKLDDVIICCDDKKILKVAKKFNAKAIITSKKHKNGTERIYEAYKKIKKNYDYVIDIQGDEPLINPQQIDNVIKFHLKNKDSDIILPSMSLKNISSYNIVKVVADKKGRVLYLSRSKIPHNFKRNEDYYLKHLSIISFKPEALKKFSMEKVSRLEKIEGVELLRAIEIGLKVYTTIIKGDSFSVDIKEDFLKAKRFMEKDKLFKIYEKK